MFFNPRGNILRQTQLFSISKILFAAFFLMSPPVSGLGQERPCLQLRNKEIKFVKTSDTTAGPECRNLRRRNVAPGQNRGIDDISVAGHVTHQNGVRMAGVTMTLEDLDTGALRTVVTNDEGTYFFDGLQIADRIELTPSKENYEFFPPSVVVEGIVFDEVFNFIAAGPPPTPAPPPANQPTLAWTSYYDNPVQPGSAPNADYNAMLARDAAGNVFVAGTSFTENFDQTGNTDISIYKTDANGNRVWSRTFNGTGNYKDGAVDLAVDAAGNAYVTGYSYVGANGDYDYATVKYSPEGSLLWSKYYAGNGGEDIPRSLKTDAAGNVYVTGYSWGNYANYATVKYDTNGNQLWAKRYAGGFGEMANEVEVDTAGNVFVTGYSGNSVAGDALDFLTVKYGPTGEQLWVNRYNSPGQRNDEAAELEINPAGDVIVMGLSDEFSNGYTIVQKINSASGTTAWTKNLHPYDEHNKDLEYRPYAMKLDPGGNIILAGQIYDYFNDDLDVYVSKLDPQGGQQWLKTYDGPGSHDYDGDPKLALDAQGNVYLGVSSEGFANFDMQILKYLANGDRDWTYRFGSPYLYDDYFIEWLDDNSQMNIFVDAEGNVTVAGDSQIPGQSVNLVSFKLEPIAAERAAPFDFDGDKRADIAVFRPESGVWYIQKSTDGTYAIVKWGLANDR